MPAVSVLNAENPFELFFRDPVYLEFKNHLYNYLRRKEEIASFLGRATGPVLEVGSGVSPVTEGEGFLIYSDMSEEAVRILTRAKAGRRAVALSATDIPFKDQSVSVLVSSEVLEHIADDERALSEMTRVLKPGGRLILTVPAHAVYFSYDDHFVKHVRRYSVKALVRTLGGLGFVDFRVSKVAGLLEKISMIGVVFAFHLLSRRKREAGREERRPAAAHPWLSRLLPIYKAANRGYAQLVKWEAKLMPLALTSIVLVTCVKRPGK
ncbi:MAG: methyltransferase domain-containing protein [Candidatus Omnitrophica bacterium]|nr:methyltransferase domain-containing protein [Candidatus Omnitrophota bacterium]